MKSGQERDRALRKLNDAGIGAVVYYPEPLHLMEYICSYPGLNSLPNAEMVAKEVISIPIHPLLTKNDLDFIVQEVNKL